MRALSVGLLLAVLAGCDRTPAPVPSDDDGTAASRMSWAREALSRNPRFEIVAADEHQEVFTVRDRNSGEIAALRIDDLIAAPVSQLSAPTPQARERTPAALAPEAVPVQASATVTATAPAVEHESAPPVAMSADSGYTIERSAGHIKVSGPGVSIVSASQANGSARTPERPPAQEPIICEGRRMLQLDGRQIFVSGNAITARDGCELHLTNSHVNATGTALIVDGATVHVSNSTIEGGTASFDASNGARLIVRASRFRGVSHRSEGVSVQDQGGNQWR